MVPPVNINKTELLFSILIFEKSFILQSYNKYFKQSTPKHTFFILFVSDFFISLSNQNNNHRLFSSNYRCLKKQKSTKNNKLSSQKSKNKTCSFLSLLQSQKRLQKNQSFVLFLKKYYYLCKSKSQIITNT